MAVAAVCIYGSTVVAVAAVCIYGTTVVAVAVVCIYGSTVVAVAAVCIYGSTVVAVAAVCIYGSTVVAVAAVCIYGTTVMAVAVVKEGRYITVATKLSLRIYVAYNMRYRNVGSSTRCVYAVPQHGFKKSTWVQKYQHVSASILSSTTVY